MEFWAVSLVRYTIKRVNRVNLGGGGGDVLHILDKIKGNGILGGPTSKVQKVNSLYFEVEKS
jgi:hypothetical protein